MKYKVMWIDDNPKDQGGFEDFAFVNDINLIHFTTSKEGREELDKRIEQYDAVILDGLVFDEDTSEVPALKGLQNSILKLKELKSRRPIPYFIFTGHLGDNKYDAIRDMLSGEMIFYKPKDNQKLIESIKAAADTQEITQLKHKYPNAFALCEDNFLGNKQFDKILQLIKDVETPENITNQQDELLRIRKILEALFEKLHKIGFIPDEIQNGKGAINGASIFLASGNKSYNYNKELIHPVIAESIRHLLSLTQDASHNEGTKLRADTYLTNNSNTYLYQSLCYSMLEVLDYIKPHIEENPYKEANTQNWSLKQASNITNDAITGTIIRVANEWGTFQSNQHPTTISVLPQLMHEYNLEEGSEIKVTIKLSQDGLKTYIDQFLEKAN